MQLTDLEKAMIIRIAEDEYGDDPGDPRWTDIICESRADSAIVGSLVKKGLLTTQNFGSRKEWTLRLTAHGCNEYRYLRPDSAYAIDQAQLDIEQAAAERGHPNL